MIYLILFFGLIIRLISINQSLWLDEATSALVAKMPLGEIFTKFLPGDFHPPFYYLVLKFWTFLFGYSEVSLRFPSVIFGVALIYAVYKITDLIADGQSKHLPLAPATLMATSGLGVYYSQEARMYSLAALTVSVCVYYFVKTIKSGRVGDFVLWAVFFTLAVMTDYLPVLTLPVFWLSGAVLKKNFSWWKKFFASHIIILVMTAPWLPYMYKQISLGFSVESVSPAWWAILGQPSVKNILLIPAKFIFGRIGIENKVIYGLGAGLIVGFFAVPIFASIRQVRVNKLLPVIWLWLTVPVLMGILLSFKVPVLSYFRFLFVLPAFYILLALGIGRMKNFKSLLFGFVLAVNLASLGVYLLNPKFHREDWRAAANLIGDQKIIFPSHSQTEALVYYGKGKNIVSPNALPQKGEIWLSRYVWEITDPSDSARLGLTKLGYNKVSENSFNGVVFWKYQK